MTTWRLAWGSPDRSDLETRTVRDDDELTDALDWIELTSLLESVTFQVDMWLVPALTHAAPILIQFLVGDHQRGCLLWHCDGESLYAVDPELSEIDRNISYVRSDGTHSMEPAKTRIHPESVRESLEVYVLTERRVDRGLEWWLVPAD